MPPLALARLKSFQTHLKAGKPTRAFQEFTPQALSAFVLAAERGKLAPPVPPEVIAEAQAADIALTRLIATGELMPGHVLEELFVETQAALEKATAELSGLQVLAGIMPDLVPWVAEVFARFPIIDTRPEVRANTFKETADLIPRILALPPGDRTELFRHLGRIKDIDSQALRETSALYDNFALLPPAAQAEVNKYLQIFHTLQPLGKAWAEQSLREYSAVLERLPLIDSQGRQALIRGLAPDTLPKTIAFLGLPAEEQEEALSYLEKMRQLTKEQLLAPGMDLRDQLRLLAAPILPAVRLAVIEEYLGRNDSGLLGAKTMAKIDALKKDPDPTVREGANLVYGEKELRDDLVKLAECQDQTVRVGIINRYLDLKERHAGLRRIRALREHGNPSLKLGAERLYYLWVRNAVVAGTDLSRVPGIGKDLWAIINNDDEGEEIKATADKVNRGLQEIRKASNHGV